MKIIKLTNEHYIIVDDSEIKEGDWYYWEVTKTIQIAKLDSLNRLPKNSDGSKKITHSTQPLTAIDFNNSTDEEQVAYFNFINGYASVKYIPLQEVKELINEVDVEKKAEKWFLINQYNQQDMIHSHRIPEYITTKNLWVTAYNQCLEDNKEKKYTEEDLKRYHNIMCLYGNVKGEEYIQSLQPKTEWEVEFVDGKIKLK